MLILLILTVLVEIYSIYHLHSMLFQKPFLVLGIMHVTHFALASLALVGVIQRNRTWFRPFMVWYILVQVPLSIVVTVLYIFVLDPHVYVDAGIREAKKWAPNVDDKVWQDERERQVVFMRTAMPIALSIAFVIKVWISFCMIGYYKSLNKQMQAEYVAVKCEEVEKTAVEKV